VANNSGVYNLVNTFVGNISASGQINVLGNVNAGDGNFSGNITATSVVNSNVLVLNANNAIYTSDVLRIQASTTGTGFNMISARNGAGNVFRVNGGGGVFSIGAYNTSGADYAEMFEWEDGNTNNEDRWGKTVVMTTGGFIRISSNADPTCNVFGVVSVNPSVVGDTYWSEWSGKYVRDRAGRKLSNTVYYISNVSNETDSVRCGINDTPPDGYEKTSAVEYTINPAYNPNLEYIPREQRPAWTPVGLVGKLRVIPGEPINPNWLYLRNIPHVDGDVSEYLVK
jgi:hypothetical protein